MRCSVPRGPVHRRPGRVTSLTGQGFLRLIWHKGRALHGLALPHVSATDPIARSSLKSLRINLRRRSRVRAYRQFSLPLTSHPSLTAGPRPGQVK